MTTSMVFEFQYSKYISSVSILGPLKCFIDKDELYRKN